MIRVAASGGCVHTYPHVSNVTSNVFNVRVSHVDVLLFSHCKQKVNYDHYKCKNFTAGRPSVGSRPGPVICFSMIINKVVQLCDEFMFKPVDLFN
jgi:hypothetical protein